MDYIEANFVLSPLQPFSEVLTAELAEIGFESFIETETGILGYSQQKEFNEKTVAQCIAEIILHGCEIKYDFKIIPAQNWNKSWEDSFEPIVIDNRCIIRAPFHSLNSKVEYDIVIEPKMSFGTGHHETTSMMAVELLDLDVKEKDLLDMGCGTSVLAILAKMKGATYVCAIDNDEWAYANSKENCLLNNCEEIDVKLGDADLLKPEKFDVILANINRNILLKDMGKYVKTLKKDGQLLMSGFFTVDVDSISACAKQLGLTRVDVKTMNNWALTHFMKK